jgi:chaperonin GroEL
MTRFNATRAAVRKASSRRRRRPVRATKKLEGMTGINEDQTRGIDIVRRALQAPMRQIAENAGFDGAVVAGKLIDGNDEKMGFNASDRCL